MGLPPLSTLFGFFKLCKATKCVEDSHPFQTHNQHSLTGLRIRGRNVPKPSSGRHSRKALQADVVSGINGPTQSGTQYIKT